jgi:hypothetical protein
VEPVQGSANAILETTAGQASAKRWVCSLYDIGEYINIIPIDVLLIILSK